MFQEGTRGRRVKHRTPPRKGSPDHPLERGGGGGGGGDMGETGIRQEGRVWFRGSQSGVRGMGSSPRGEEDEEEEEEEEGEKKRLSLRR